MKVSVIIPCFNVEAYIEDCLESIVRQTYKNLEIICINDGSNDDTKHRINRFNNRWSGNLTLIDQKNQGAGHARNAGLNKAEGEYIQFLDADDLLKPDKIKSQLRIAMNQSTRPAIVVGDFILVTSGREKVVRSYEKRPFHALFCKNLGVTSANLWLRSALKKSGGFDELRKSAQEYELMFRLMKQGGEVAFDPAPLTIKLDRNEGSISAENRRDNRLRFIALQNTILAYLKESGKLDSDFENFIYHKILYDIRLLHELDPSKSYQLYKEHIPASFKLKSTREISKKYVVLYELLGYRATQGMIGMLNRIFR